MTGKTACGDASWGWGSGGGIDVDEDEGEASDDDDNEGSTDVDGSVGIVGIKPKSSGIAADDAIGEVGQTGVVVGAAPPGTKPCRKFAVSRRGGMTGATN